MTGPLKQIMDCRASCRVDFDPPFADVQPEAGPAAATVDLNAVLAEFPEHAEPQFWGEDVAQIW